VGDEGTAESKAERFHLGADVHTSDGKEVGKLVHVLVGPEYQLRALIVKENASFSPHRLAPTSWLVADEFIVPEDAATKVTRDRIELNVTAADVRRLPPYIGYQEKGESVAEFAEDAAGVLGSGPELPNWMEQVANKKPDELEIDGGENVMLGRSGRRLGTVKDVLFDDGQLVGVVVQPDGWFKSEVILPRRFLDRSDDLALFANIGEADLERLTPFRPPD
jgi:sporulation protein YlmC with PRC-barrel domain